MTHTWMVASIALFVPLALGLVALGRGSVPMRIAALPLTSTLAILLLAMLDFAFDQAAAIDIALALALLSLPGSLLFALFEERWL